MLVLAFAKFDSTSVYFIPYCTEVDLPFIVLVSINGSLVNVFVTLSASSLSTYTFILSFVMSELLIYLSVTLNTIVSVLAAVFTVDDNFSISGFTKSTCPNVNIVSLLLLFDLSTKVFAAIFI